MPNAVPVITLTLTQGAPCGARRCLRQSEERLRRAVLVCDCAGGVETHRQRLCVELRVDPKNMRCGIILCLYAQMSFSFSLSLSLSLSLALLHM